MLGQFLEYSVAAQPLAASFEFFRALGFTSIPVGDTLPEPYVALFDGAITVGLHDRQQTAPQLTFVRPGLRDYVRPLRRLGIAVTDEHLRDNEFNSITFTDPGGQHIALIEARTFPPGVWDTQNVAACGEFFELSLPASALETSSRFWQSVGFTLAASGEAPHRWQRLVGRGLTVGLHETHFAQGLSFRCDGLQGRLEYLQAKGITTRAGTPLADRAQPSATIAAPDGTRLYVFEKGAQ
jgi:hypothetical protein